MNTFTTPAASADGRTLTSAITVVERTDGSRIDLEISTAHWKGRGYAATASRVHAEGVMRSLALTFGDDSDTRRLPALDGAPDARARFSRKVLGALHTRVTAQIADDLDTWMAWAENCKAAARN